MEQARKIIPGRIDIYRAFEVDLDLIGIDTHLLGERGGILIYTPRPCREGLDLSFYHTIYDAADVLADRIVDSRKVKIHFPVEAGFFSHGTEQGIRRFIANPMSAEDRDYFMEQLAQSSSLSNQQDT